ncbi:AfsR/SARP family transcriptional regulator [Nonomuraea wenchangensis]|uniref:DNA-binding transcriptional activator of the SARP family n=1 Tax=Nonomuraea wenchangensis TaxID=568860 RepID=A0A1I0AKX6_9ACTN|nr:BTAD domain-containing putative transcriptional regulator [Nonomuraea wenchangensis]SES94903.1 DNA-binding transcriptional activator of the SARP family [Nonomuraea wenchangensis]
MKVNLLGPLEVRCEGDVVTPSAPKLRRMLSLLVVHANSVVPNEQIIEELWDANPPTTVTTTLQTYVYQLRKTLRHHGGERGPDAAGLHTSLGGYLMSLPPDVVDLMRFERLAQAGRAALEAGEFEQAAANLSQGLGLWHGPMLADVSQGPVLRAEVLRLEELRRNTLEQRIEADLQLGRHREVLDELVRLAEEQPTHEGFQAKLMVALYRAERPQEALHVYRRTCSALASELGLDPSRRLQRIQHAIMSADRSLDVPSVADRVSVHPGPVHPAEGTLVGRQRHVELALRGLAAGREHVPAVVVISGPPGSGKSALCTEVGARAAERYPDGQVHADALDAAGRPLDAGGLLLTLLRAIGLPEDLIPAADEERARLFRAWTAERRILVTLDDVADVGQLLPLLPSNSACGVLVVSRRLLYSPEITSTVSLGPLGVDEGVELLAGLLGCRRVAAERAAAGQLVQLCGGLPSTLSDVAERLLCEPHESLERALGRVRGELSGPVPPACGGIGPRESVERSYRLASPDARRTFRLMSTAGTAVFPVPAVARLLGVPEYQAEYRLEELVDLWLVEVVPGARDGWPHYRVLPSVRQVGRRFAEEAGDGLAPEAPRQPAARPPLVQVPQEV